MKSNFIHQSRLSFLGLIVFVLLVSLCSILAPYVARANPANNNVNRLCEDLTRMPGNEFGENGVIDNVYMESVDGPGQEYIVPPGVNRINVNIKGFMVACSEWADINGTYYPTTSQDSINIRDDRQGRLAAPNIIYDSITKSYGQRKAAPLETVRATLDVSGWGDGNHTVCITSAIRGNDEWFQWIGPQVEKCQTITIERQKSWSVLQEQAYIQRVTPGNTNSNIGGKLGPTINAVPGQHYKFVYQWINNGPDATSRTVNIGRTYTYPGAATVDEQSFTSAGAGVSRNGNIYFGSPGHTGVIQQSDVGREYYMRTYVAPRAWNDNGRNSGTILRVRVPFNFNLIPSINDLSDVIEVGAAVPEVIPKVNNNGPTKSHSNIRWVVSRIVVPAGGSIPQITQENGTQPCGHYANQPGVACEVRAGNREFPNNATTTIAEGRIDDDTIEDLEAGERVCYALSVRQYEDISTDWRHSAAECMTVGKKPKVQIHGGDLSVGKYFNGHTAPTTASIVDTSISEKESGTFGSWIEYGILAPGAITGAASASGLSGDGLPNAQNSWSDLTFANTNAGACPFGCYNQANTMGMMPNIAAEFPVSATTQVMPSSSSINSLNGVYRGSGTIRLQAGELPAGRTVVINAPSARVIIESNGSDNSLRYANGPYTSINDLPQLVIIADRIDIRDSIERIDGWLVAKSNGAQGSSGIVDTCAFSDDYDADLTADMCGTQLTINGPVMAEKLWLRRTAGSGTGPENSGVPAEIINLRADTYLWATARSEADGRARTVKQTDVAPRF